MKLTWPFSLCYASIDYHMLLGAQVQLMLRVYHMLLRAFQLMLRVYHMLLGAFQLIMLRVYHMLLREAQVSHGRGVIWCRRVSCHQVSCNAVQNKER